MGNNFDKNMQGGRLRHVGAPEDPDDAVRLCDLKTVLAQGAGAGFPYGGGKGAQGPQGIPGPAGPGGPPGPVGPPINISAGTVSENLTAVTFQNGNGVSFGLDASTITASIATSPNINLSAGTTSNLASAFTFSNSNNVSFGLNASTITAQAAVNLSAGTTSQNLSNFVFSNSNNVSFGLNGSTITASVSQASMQASINLSAGTTSNMLSAVTFSNSNGISFGLNASTITASVATSLTNVNISAGTTSQNLSNFVFSNSNNVSFGLNGSTVTASVASSLTAINVSAGTTSNNLTQVVFSNSNNVSFGLSGSTVTATVLVSTVTLSLWENLSGTMFQGSTYNTLSVVPLSPLVFPGLMTASTFLVGMDGVGSQSTQPGTMLFSFGIYTLNASTLSLLNSAATSITYGAVSNNSVLYSGFRWLSVHSTQWSVAPVFSQTHYWLGYIISSSNQTQSLMWVGQNFANAQGRFGTMGVTQAASAGSLGWTPFMGAYTVTTGALPASINQSDLNAGATSVGNFLPQVVLNNVMASF